MELFGVQEIPTSRAHIAPGWAYVADSGPSSALQPTNRKKRAARNQPSGSANEHSAQQHAKILRDLAVLDKEGQRDVQIPVPVRHRDNAGRVSHGKVTQNVRKILISQKTFANHLDDAVALAALAAQQPQALNQPGARPSGAASRAQASAPQGTNPAKRVHKKKDTSARSTPQPIVRPEASASEDTAMADATNASVPILTPLPATLELKTHPADNDPLLKSRIPPAPTEAELAALMAAPPLTYFEAKGQFMPEDLTRPTRAFCELCGYWGRVKCMRCGTRVCALECLSTHQEDCFTRYGA